MRRMKLLSIPLLVSFILPISLNAAEINCDSPVWKKKAICNKKKAKLKEPKFCKNPDISAIQKEECLNYQNYLKIKNARKPPKYPVIFYDVNQINDPSIGKNVWKTWTSDKEYLEIALTRGIYVKKREKKIITKFHSIPKERIISFNQSLIDMSDNAAQLATNVGITAVIVPILALGQGINYKKNEHYKWEITFIDDYGREATEILYPVSTVPVADRYYTFLPDFTGLKNGEVRSEESLRGFYLDGMKKFQEKIERDFVNLSTYNPEKDCRELNSSNFPLSSNIFLDEKKQLDSLREKFGSESYVIKGACS